MSQRKLQRKLRGQRACILVCRPAPCAVQVAAQAAERCSASCSASCAGSAHAFSSVGLYLA
eukprot:12124425-Alexandrium_andersonii.AAC.1